MSILSYVIVFKYLLGSVSIQGECRKVATSKQNDDSGVTYDTHTNRLK